MKKILQSINPFFSLMSGLAFCVLLSTSACKTKEGCPTDGYTNAMDKGKKRGKTQLFDKKTTRRMKN
jgi:hypothetical protein